MNNNSEIFFYWSKILKENFNCKKEPIYIGGGLNSVWLLPCKTKVVRVSSIPQNLDVDISESSFNIAQREIDIAHCLLNSGIKTPKPLLTNPIIIEGHPITLWNFVSSGSEPINGNDIGIVLKNFMSCFNKNKIEAPLLDPFSRIETRFKNFNENKTRQRLLYQMEKCKNIWSHYYSPYSFQIIHGDLHKNNLIKDKKSKTWILDFDASCIGPLEWDLAIILSETFLGNENLKFCYDAINSLNYNNDFIKRAIILSRIRTLHCIAWNVFCYKKEEKINDYNKIINRLNSIEKEKDTIFLNKYFIY